MKRQKNNIKILLFFVSQQYHPSHTQTFFATLCYIESNNKQQRQVTLKDESTSIHNMSDVILDSLFHV